MLTTGLVDTNLTNIWYCIILDLRTSSFFLQTEAQLTKKEAPKSKRSTKVNQCLNGRRRKGKMYTLRILGHSALPKKNGYVHKPSSLEYSLISNVRLGNRKCDIKSTMGDIGVDIQYRERLILKGSRCTNTGLWMVPLIPTIFSNFDPRYKQRRTTKIFFDQTEQNRANISSQAYSTTVRQNSITPSI